MGEAKSVIKLTDKPLDSFLFPQLCDREQINWPDKKNNNKALFFCNFFLLLPFFLVHLLENCNKLLLMYNCFKDFRTSECVFWIALYNS